MDILIVAKTKMAHNICVGGILLRGKRFVRLLDAFGNNQPVDTDFEIRDIWDIDFTYKKDTLLPHKEDILVKKYRNRRRLKDDLTMLDVLNKLQIPYWEGKLDFVFDGNLQWTMNGSGYISKDRVPGQSVGFWIADKELIMNIEDEKIRYYYGERRIPYVGLEEPVSNIPAGTLLRVSLARWWSPPDSDIEKRCYLQLSGWYDLEAIDDDIPF
jgi:hypothetical protein